MSLVELRAFDAVARGGGFVRGADLIGRTQPTVTAQVRALEERYGVELFFRTRGQLARLTPAGEKLFETTRALFRMEEDAALILEAVHKKLDGVLRLGAIAPRSSMRIVAAFCVAHPNIKIELKIMNSTSIQSALRNFDIDVGLLGAHTRDASLHMQSISRPEIVLLAQRDDVFRPKRIITKAEFSRRTLLLREIGSETRALMERAMEAHGYTPDRVFEIASREGVNAAAEYGLGLAPISIDEIDRSYDVQVVRFADFKLFGEMFLACASSRRHTPLITSFLSIAAQMEPLSPPAAELRRPQVRSARQNR
jgi:LysR family transcriptional regulator, low CO2-responsive transcriptional regulator